MSEILSLDFSSSFNLVTHLFSQRYHVLKHTATTNPFIEYPTRVFLNSHEPDLAIPRLVSVSLETPHVPLDSHDHITTALDTGRSALNEFWTGPVQEIRRPLTNVNTTVPPVKWHPKRTFHDLPVSYELVDYAKEDFLENSRWFLEGCDSPSGYHMFVDTSSSIRVSFAHQIVTELVDTMCKAPIVCFAQHKGILPNPHEAHCVAALSAAHLGQIVYVPFLLPDEIHMNHLATHVDTLTMGHTYSKQPRLKDDFATVMGIPGGIAFCDVAANIYEKSPPRTRDWLFHTSPTSSRDVYCRKLTMRNCIDVKNPQGMNDTLMYKYLETWHDEERLIRDVTVRSVPCASPSPPVRCDMTSVEFASNGLKWLQSAAQQVTDEDDAELLNDAVIGQNWEF